MNKLTLAMIHSDARTELFYAQGDFTPTYSDYKALVTLARAYKPACKEAEQLSDEGRYIEADRIEGHSNHILECFANLYDNAYTEQNGKLLHAIACKYSAWF